MAVPPDRPHELSAPWHALTTDACFAKVGSCAEGLTQEEARRRLIRFGPNEVPAGEAVSPWRILARQFHNPLIALLLVAVALAAVLGQSTESAVIFAIVILAGLLGFVQEYRAERAVEELRKLASPTATVLRDGQRQNLPARDLVPGDVVLLEAGDRVSADLRLLETVRLRADESALTGESVPVEKEAEALESPDAGLGDRRNMAFSGTIVLAGRGKGLVVAAAASVAVVVEVGKWTIRRTAGRKL